MMGIYSSFSPRILVLLVCVVILCLVSNCLPVSALQVAPGSNCTMLCYGQVSFSNTTTEDVTCYDKEYDSTSVGKVFKNCVACEMSSESFNPGTLQTDLQWALFNMRYTLAWCLFGFPTYESPAVTPCDDSCGSLSNSLERNILNASASQPYDYCEDLNSGAVKQCAACYSKTSDRFYLSNFLRLLDSACERKILPPTPFPIESSQIFTRHPPSNYSTATPPTSTSSSLSTKAKLAIGIGVPVFLLAILTFVILFWCSRTHLRMKHHGSSPNSKFQLHDRRVGKDQKDQRDHKEMDWAGGNHSIIYHPTPALRNITYPKPMAADYSKKVGNQKRATSITMTLSPRSSPPPRVPRIPHSSILAAMKQDRNSHTRAKSRISFDRSNRMPKRKMRIGWKEPTNLEDLFS